MCSSSLLSCTERALVHTEAYPTFPFDCLIVQSKLSPCAETRSVTAVCIVVHQRAPCFSPSRPIFTCWRDPPKCHSRTSLQLWFCLAVSGPWLLFSKCSGAWLYSIHMVCLHNCATSRKLFEILTPKLRKPPPPPPIISPLSVLHPYSILHIHTT